jgi:excisionase family DNA binding protein
MNDSIVFLTKSDLASIIEDAVINAMQVSDKRLSNEEEETLLSVEEAAEYFGKSKQTIYNWIKREVIKPYRIDKNIYFKKSELNDNLRSQRILGGGYE